MIKTRQGRINALELEAAAAVEPPIDIAKIVVAQLPATVAKSVGWEDLTNNKQPPSPNDILVTVEVKVELEEVQKDGNVVVVAPPHLRRGYPTMPLAVLRSGSYASEHSALDPDLAFQWELPPGVDLETPPIPEVDEEEEGLEDRLTESERRASSVYEPNYPERRQIARDERDTMRRRQREEEAAFRLVASQL